jgi:hypothetical protein
MPLSIKGPSTIQVKNLSYYIGEGILWPPLNFGPNTLKLLSHIMGGHEEAHAFLYT